MEKANIPELTWETLSIKCMNGEKKLLIIQGIHFLQAKTERKFLIIFTLPFHILIDINKVGSQFLNHNSGLAHV